MQNYVDVHKKRKIQQIDDVDSFNRWEELPNGPLVEIAEQLANFEDFEALHLVCHRWNSALRSSRCKFLAGGGHVGHCTFQVPWLLMADQEQGAESNVSSSLRPCSTKSNTMRLFFYRLSLDRVHRMLLRLPPQLNIDQQNFREWSFFSSRGWLFIITKKKTISLYNPSCGTAHNYYIPLPENRFLANDATRFTLSACPCTNTYIVMLLYGNNELAFWRPGDEQWTILNAFSFISGFILDVTHYKGHVLGLNNKGEVFLMCKEEDRGEDYKPRREFWACNIATLFPDCTDQYLWKAYFVLVESSQKLFVVVRVPLHPAERQPYFLDCGKGKDMGVYNMADGSIARHFEGESLGDYSPMLWV